MGNATVRAYTFPVTADMHNGISVQKRGCTGDAIGLAGSNVRNKKVVR